MKIVGTRVPPSNSPADYVHRAARLIAAADRLAGSPKPRGYVVKCRSWDDYEKWKSGQTNPRHW